MLAFCEEFCGTCDRCNRALREVERIDAIYESLTDEECDSLLRPDRDDPYSFALDSYGRP